MSKKEFWLSVLLIAVLIIAVMIGGMIDQSLLADGYIH